jgi:site-specific DNA-methyltransferase (adenine-specific)
LQLAANKIGAIDDILDVVAAELLRVTRRWIVVFCDDEIAQRWRAAFGDAYVRTGIWVKTDPMPQVTGDRPAQGHEPAIIAHRPGRKRWNGGGRPATWIYGTSKGNERAPHPCPKPFALMRQLVADFSDPGERVLDAFSGSGTTGLACKAMGRSFLGYEINPEYAEIARRRIAGMDAVETAQMALFG